MLPTALLDRLSGPSSVPVLAPLSNLAHDKKTMPEERIGRRFA